MQTVEDDDFDESTAVVVVVAEAVEMSVISDKNRWRFFMVVLKNLRFVCAWLIVLMESIIIRRQKLIFSDFGSFPGNYWDKWTW